MRAAQRDQYGGPEVVEVREVEACPVRGGAGPRAGGISQPGGP